MTQYSTCAESVITYAAQTTVLYNVYPQHQQVGCIADYLCDLFVSHMQELDRGEHLVLEVSASFRLQQSMYVTSCTKR